MVHNGSWEAKGWIVPSIHLLSLNSKFILQYVLQKELDLSVEGTAWTPEEGALWLFAAATRSVEGACPQVSEDTWWCSTPNMHPEHTICWWPHSLGPDWCLFSCDSKQMLHVPGLQLTLVFLFPVQAHEPGCQLWLTSAPFVPRRAASCLPSDCRIALVQTNQQTSPLPSRLQLYLSHWGRNPSLGRVPAF